LAKPTAKQKAQDILMYATDEKLEMQSGKWGEMPGIAILIRAQIPMEKLCNRCGTTG